MEVESLSPNIITDSGLIEDERFIDTTGELDLISFYLDAPSYTNLYYTVDFYQSSESNSIFPSEWVLTPALDPTADLTVISPSTRYLILNFNFESDPGDFDFYLRVQIDVPIMTPRYLETQKLLYKLPSWMAMREIENDYQATPQLATPISLGGSYVNAIAGEWLDDIASQINYRNMQLFIDTVDLNQKAWVWLSTNIPDYPYSFIGDGVECVVAVNDYEFYQSDPSEDIIFWDELHQKVYSNKLYNNFEINGITFPQQLSQVWNPLDDLGLLVNLWRLSGEDNYTFQARILDVYQNLPGAGVVNFQNAIRRELNLWALYGSTPNSQYIGATPEVYGIWDLQDPSLGFVGPNQIPNPTFINLVNFIAQNYPTTWGNFLWDQAYSDIAGPQYQGYNVLPQQLDATPMLEQYTHSGVGDLNDLLITTPAPIDGPLPFEAQIIVRGQEEVPQKQYSPIMAQFTLQAQTTELVYVNPPVTQWLTLIFDCSGSATPGSGVFFYSFQLTSTSDVDFVNPSPSAASWASLSIFQSDGTLNPQIILTDYYSGTTLTQRLMISQIQSITLENGQYIYGTGFTNQATSNNFQAWFSTNPSTTLTYNSSPITLNSSMIGIMNVEMESLETATTQQEWQSYIYNYTAFINDTNNITTLAPAIINVPSIYWPTSMVQGAKQEYILTITNVQAQNIDSTITVLDPTYVSLNGSNAWVNSSQILPGTTTQLIFNSINTNSLYPYVGSTYQMFEVTLPQIISGQVDQNGPWINGYAPSIGNTNYLFMSLNLGRSNFNIPTTSSYQPTWIGVQSNDQNIIMWLSTNNIIESNSYSWEEIGLYVQLNPIPDPHWYPQMHAGTFFYGQQEYYSYVDATTEFITGSSPNLTYLARQGAPIIITTNEATPQYLRQVCFYNWDTTPTQLSIYNTETVQGTYQPWLYAQYPNIYDITVTDLATSTPILTNGVASPYNIIYLPATTDYTDTYQLQYKVRNSFYADNDFLLNEATPCTQIVFDSIFNGGYFATYETNYLNNSTPIPIALNPLYTVNNNGFIFIDYNEYPLTYLIINLSQSYLINDGNDYILITIQTLDQNTNPKINQSLNITTNFGTLNSSTIVTDNDGHASAILYAPATPQHFNGSGLIKIYNNTISGQIPFNIKVQSPPRNNIIAVSASEEIRANGSDIQYIYGHIQDANLNPIANNVIYWQQARSNYDLFSPSGNIEMSGVTLSDATGNFVVGPFTAATVPGYWFVSLETAPGATPTYYPYANTNIYAPPNQTYEYGYPTITSNVGDIVYWLEYPDISTGQQQFTGIPNVPIQMATPTSYMPTCYVYPRYPIYYDSDEIVSPATPGATPSWVPPNWFPIPVFDQWEYFGFNPSGTPDYWSKYIASSTPPFPQIKDYE